MAVPAPAIRACAPPTPPPSLTCTQTRIYGAPRGRPGRSPTGFPVDEVPILAIALHCIKDTYDGYLHKVCSSDGKLFPNGHGSFHYVVDAEGGAITALVDEANLAWSFQSYLSNFPTTAPVQPPPCPPVDCGPIPCPPPPPVILPACVAYPGWSVLCTMFPYSADFYTINIGITVPNRAEENVLDGVDCCAGPFGMTEETYAKVVRLVNWIAYRYNIPFDNQHIAFHDQIVNTLMGCEECKCDSDEHCFVCDVSAYCEQCVNPGDSTFALSSTIAWVYGEDAGGCKVKVPLSDLKTLLDAL